MGLSDLKKAELVALAKEHDLDASGTKADLVERLEPVVDWDEPEDEEVVEEAPAKSSKKSDGVDIDAIVAEGADMEDDDFVVLAYQKILRRDPDQSGKKHYSACIWFHKTMTRAQVCEALMESPEYKSLMESL